MKHTALRFIRLWLAFFRNSLSRDMEFKMNFIGNLFIDSIFYGSLFFFFSVIFSYIDANVIRRSISFQRRSINGIVGL